MQDSDLGIIGFKSPPIEKSGFLPVFRSGSCSEKGPKQFMEDEYICVDNLYEHFDSAVQVPSPGAFYGVCIFFVCYCLAYFVLDHLQYMSRHFKGPISMQLPLTT